MSKSEDEGQHLTCGRLIISMAWGRGGREGKNTCKRIEKHQRERPPLSIKSAKITSRVTKQKIRIGAEANQEWGSTTKVGLDNLSGN